MLDLSQSALHVLAHLVLDQFELGIPNAALNEPRERNRIRQFDHFALELGREYFHARSRYLQRTIAANVELHDIVAVKRPDIERLIFAVLDVEAFLLFRQDFEPNLARHFVRKPDALVRDFHPACQFFYIEHISVLSLLLPTAASALVNSLGLSPWRTRIAFGRSAVDQGGDLPPGNRSL